MRHCDNTEGDVQLPNQEMIDNDENTKNNNKLILATTCHLLYFQSLRLDVCSIHLMINASDGSHAKVKRASIFFYRSTLSTNFYFPFFFFKNK